MEESLHEANYKADLLNEEVCKLKVGLPGKRFALHYLISSYLFNFSPLFTLYFVTC